MIMRKYSALLIAGIYMLMIASSAYAQQPGHHMGPGQGMMGHRSGTAGMASQLNAEQQQTLQKIHNAHQNAFADISRKLWAKQVQLQAALTEDKIDDGKIKTLTNDINKLRSSLFEEQVKMQMELSKAGLAYYTMKGGMMGHGMGAGMMDAGMMGGMGGCPMMSSGEAGPDSAYLPAQ